MLGLLPQTWQPKVLAQERSMKSNLQLTLICPKILFADGPPGMRECVLKCWLSRERRLHNQRCTVVRKIEWENNLFVYVLHPTIISERKVLPLHKVYIYYASSIKVSLTYLFFSRMMAHQIGWINLACSVNCIWEANAGQSAAGHLKMSGSLTRLRRVTCWSEIVGASKLLGGLAWHNIEEC